jgi:hypothetical protein
MPSQVGVLKFQCYCSDDYHAWSMQSARFCVPRSVLSAHVAALTTFNELQGNCCKRWLNHLGPLLIELWWLTYVAYAFVCVYIPVAMRFPWHCVGRACMLPCGLQSDAVARARITYAWHRCTGVTLSTETSTYTIETCVCGVQNQAQGGASHTWLLYVRAPDNSDLSHIVSKVR